MSTNGSTAMDLSGAAMDWGPVLTVVLAEWPVRLEIQSLSTAKPVSVTVSTTPVTHSPAFDRQGESTGLPDGREVMEVRDAEVAACGYGASGDNSRRTRSTNAGGVSPHGNRVHCTSWNLSGTAARRSGVASIATGSRNAFFSNMSCVRSTASFHSRRK